MLLKLTLATLICFVIAISLFLVEVFKDIQVTKDGKDMTSRFRLTIVLFAISSLFSYIINVLSVTK